MKKWLPIILALLASVIASSGCVRPHQGPPIPVVPIVAPIVTAPIRVVIVKDNATANRLPSAQLAALNSSNLRNYCQSHCQLGPDGRTPEFRTYTWDADLRMQSQGIRDAFNDAVLNGKSSGVPWLVVNNGTTGYSGPFPATDADLMAVLKKYGGE
ncbi:MAG: hypothetical protein V4719_00885 [Planctomycetota bacterium]